MVGVKIVSSYYHCQHCREQISIQIQCPCCSLGNPIYPSHAQEESLFDDFFSWLSIHRTAREHLFHQMREKYDWGYITACKVIEAELRRKLQEHKDDSDRFEGDKGLLE